MMNDFNVNVVVECGCPHYKIVDVENGNEVHCDLNELKETIEELLKNTIH